MKKFYMLGNMLGLFINILCMLSNIRLIFLGRSCIDIYYIDSKDINYLDVLFDFRSYVFYILRVFLVL